MKNSNILRIKDLARYLNVSRSTIYYWLDVKSKYYKANFPKPIQLSLRAKGWLKSEPPRVFRRQFILSQATLADSSSWR